MKDNSMNYVGYLEDQREDSKGKIIGVTNHNTLSLYGELEKKYRKAKRPDMIQFIVLDKKIGEKKYNALIEKANKK